MEKFDMKILYIHSENSQKNLVSDYMSDVLLHGLRSLFGNDVVDYPGSWHMYDAEVHKRNFDKNDLWGKGFTVQGTLKDYETIDRSDIENKIKNKYFDLLIFSSSRRSKIFLDEAIKYNNDIIFIDGEDDQFIDYDLIKKGLYFKRELNINHKNILPINFAIPEEKIIKTINKNPKNLLAPLIPGKKKTYIYENENDYYNMYSESIFALTYKKAGWDCLRHYEILMNGCLPLFLHFEKCPVNTMTNFPKNEIQDINKKYLKILNFFNPMQVYYKKFLSLKIFVNYFKNYFEKKIDIKDFIIENSEIFDLKEKMLNFTKTKLTTKVLAKQIIQKIKFHTK